MPATAKPFAQVPNPNVNKKPVGKFRQYGRNFLLRPLLGAFGVNVPAYNEEGYLDDNALLEFVETLPDEIKVPLNEMIENIMPHIGEITGPLPELTFDELRNALPEGVLPSPEDLSGMLPDLKQADFAPIAQEAQRRFTQETVPGILNQLTGLGQNAGSSAFAGSLGRAGSDLQSKLAALESQHNLQQGQLQLGRGELGRGLYHAGTQRAGILGNLQNDQNRLRMGQSEALGRLQLGQQGNQLNQRGQALSALTGQMNRPTTGYQPPASSNLWADAAPAIQKGLQLAMMAL